MPKKIGGATREDLVNAPLPQQTKTYTVISHSYAINTILQALEDNGFTVKEEEYRCNEGGKVAHGCFVVDYQEDPELSMVYSFSNSYDKSLRFKSTVGAKVNLNDAYMLCDMDRWIRKHTGTADNETEKTIIDHITNAKTYFSQLVKDKETMKTIAISLSEFGTVIGELFLREVLTSDQISFIGKEFKSPSYNYPTAKLNLWTCYNHIINALKMSHPSKWMHNQISVHLYFNSRYNLVPFDDDEPVDPETEQVVIDGEEVPAMTAILDQVPPVVLPGFEPPANQEIPKDQLEPQEEYVNPNQITIDQMIEANAPVAEVPAVPEEPAVQEEPQEEHYEDLPDETVEQEEPVEEVKEEPVMEEPIPEDPTPTAEYVHVPNPDEMYLPMTDFPGIEVGDCVEVDDQFVDILRAETVEGVTYLVGVPAKLTPFEEEVIHADAEDQVILETASDEPVVDESQEQQVEEVPLPEPEAMASPEMSKAPVVEEPVPVKEEPVIQQEDPKIKNVITNELEAIYGYRPEFTYVKTETQYEVTLSTGETCALTKTYIDNLL